TGDASFARVAASTLEYVARDLTRPGGGFYSAEDADSVPPEQAGDPRAHGSEGAFYVWTAEEVKQLLGEDAALACARFGIREHGNVESDPHGELAGKNVLCLARTLEELTGSSRQAGSVAARLDDVRRRLFAARAKRPRPGLDDKVIVAWNGLMVAAFARAARVLAHSEAHAEASADWLRHAQQAASFIRATMWQPGRGVLLRRFRDGHAGIEGYAEDFACLVFGLLELFQADGNPDWLEWASELQRRQDELFWDERGGGWFNTTGNDASVLLRIKEDYDGAEPAASSVSLFNALTLARLTGPSDVHARIARTFESFAGQLRGTPRAVPMMLAALSVWRSSPQEIAIVGSAGSQDTKALLAAVAFSYLPAAVVVPVDPGCQAALSRLLPFVESMTMLDGRATAYVCRDFACNRPTTEPYEVQEHIRRTAVE
ncbi:MAG: thioredoxin domain-containing protein, partial [Bacteroidales bacterium]